MQLPLLCLLGQQAPVEIYLKTDDKLHDVDSKDSTTNY